MKQPNGHEIIQLFEQFSPKKFAMEEDKIGLQIGRLNKPIQNVLVALDVIEEVVDEAIEKGAELIIAHHPLIFRPLRTIRTDDPHGRIIEKIIKHDIAVYAAHTNLDVASGGVNDLLAEALQIKNAEVLIPTYEDRLKKLIVYVPAEAEDEVRNALGNAGAGAIGNYSHCTFSSDGIGRFVPGEGTNPYLGVQGKELGIGRIGYLDNEMKLDEFAEYVKQALDVKGVRVIGNLSSTVRKVAVLGGDGDKYYRNALKKGADAYVTGDMYYHTAIDAKMEGLNIVDAGHNIEKVMKKGVAEKLMKLCNNANYKVNIFASEIDTDPFQFI